MSQTSNLGRFVADYNIGCTPLTVTLTVTDTFGNINRQYIYDDQGLTVDNFYTYTDPGTYEIIQFISFIDDNTPQFDTLTINVFEPVAPSIQVFSCSQNTARIRITDNTYDYYQIFYLNDSIRLNSQDISQVLVFPNSDIQQIRIRGYYHDAFDNCGETNLNYQPILTIESPTIRNVDIIQSCSNLLNATVDYNIAANVQHILEYSNDGGSTFQFLDTVYNSSTSSFQDLPVVSESAQFRLSAYNECLGSNEQETNVEVSELMPVILPIENITVSYEGTRAAELAWESGQFGFMNYAVNRSRNGSAFNAIATTTQGSYADSGLNPALNEYSYQIIASDTCGNTSGNSITGTPVYLSFRRERDNLYELRWNDYEGWVSGINSYNLEVLDREDVVLQNLELETPYEKLLNITNLPGDRFRIRVDAAEGGFEAISNVVTLERTKSVLLPDAFSPNGDGVNDEFLPILNNATNYKLQIYNRWGELVFQSSSVLQGWNGVYQNRIAQEGTYIYSIKFENDLGERIEQSGTFILLR